MVGDALGAEDVLDRDGTPPQRPVAATSSSRRRSRRVHEVGVSSSPAAAVAPGVEVLVGRELAARRSRRRLGDGQVEQLGHQRVGLRRGDAEGAVGRVRRAARAPPRAAGSARLVGAQDVLERDHVRGRLDPVEVELGDPVDVLEDPRELARHRLDLLLGEPSRARRATCRTWSRSITAGDSRSPRGSRRRRLRDGRPGCRSRVRASRADAGSRRRAGSSSSACGCWRLTFAVVGLLFIAVPDGDARRALRLRRMASATTPGAPHDRRAALAGARLRLHGRDHRRSASSPRPTSSATGRCCWCSPRGKAASSLTSLGFFSSTRHVFAYLLNFLVDGFLVVSSRSGSGSLAGRVGRPAEPG